MIRLSIVGLVFSFCFLITTSVFAQEQVARPQVSTKSGIAKMSCPARVEVIKKRADGLTKLTVNMEEKFASIAARAETRYLTKVIPFGMEVVNYASLAADIQTKKATVDAALKIAQHDTNTFNCVSSNSKTQMMEFRKDMQTVKSALKEYRASVKNLIVAVSKVMEGK